MTAFSTPLDQRIDARIQEAPDGCWLWTTDTNKDGYARFHFRGRFIPVHRHIYERECGPIPDGHELDHLCRVRHCVNPAHLEVVTHHENLLRGDAPAARNARKTHCKHGHPFDEENTYNRLGGGRACRACARRHAAVYKRRKETADA